MRYQKTHSDDIPELTRLWKQAFGDSDEDIACFFRDLFPAATGFAARDGEKIAAMCFALPQQLSCGDTACAKAMPALMPIPPKTSKAVISPAIAFIIPIASLRPEYNPELSIPVAKYNAPSLF